MAPTLFVQSSSADDEVLELLRQARSLLGARAADSQFLNAISHIDAAVANISPGSDEPLDLESFPGGGASSPTSIKHCCSQETQTFSSPCHSTGTQANPQTASASTGTGPRQAALGARNALQENSR